MANLSEDIQCAGFDTRPPMLDRTDFASWQQRIQLYYPEKENGVNILKSIDEGPFQMGTFREIIAEGEEGALYLGPERARVYSDISPEDKERYNAVIRATNILLQGLPKDIYTLINHYTDAKDIWDNVKMLLEGENIHDYYVRFTKLINDMRNIKITMPRMKLNSKFVNNMLPKWGRFVTAVKLNRGLKESKYDQLYAYLKQHKTHANENKMMLERCTQHTVDPLALMSNVLPQQYSSQSSTTPPSTHVPPVTYQPHFANNMQLDSRLSSTDNLIENLTNTLALLTQSYKTYLPQTNNQLITSSNTRNQAIVQDGKVVKTSIVDEDVDEPLVQDLALNVDNVFQADECDAFDSDNSEDTIEIAKITRKKMNDKMKFPMWTEQNIDIRPLDYLTENYLVTFTPQTQLTPEQIFWSKDILKIKAKALKQQTKASKPIKALMVYPPNTPATLVPKGSTKEIKEIKEIFEELEAEVDQNAMNRKSDEIEWKNLLIENDNLVAAFLSKEVFYIAKNYELTVSRFTEMHDAHTVVQARCLELEAELSK
nr:hypothetical protein [Tanacetum cinerariifolium]